MRRVRSARRERERTASSAPLFGAASPTRPIRRFSGQLRRVATTCRSFSFVAPLFLPRERNRLSSLFGCVDSRGFAVPYNSFDGSLKFFKITLTSSCYPATARARARSLIYKYPVCVYNKFIDLPPRAFLCICTRDLLATRVCVSLLRIKSTEII